MQPPNRWRICVLSWVWRPDRFTAWQTRDLRHAEDEMRKRHPDWTGETGLRVLESRDELAVEVWPESRLDSPPAGSFSRLRLNKDDFAAED